MCPNDILNHLKAPWCEYIAYRFLLRNQSNAYREKEEEAGGIENEGTVNARLESVRSGLLIFDLSDITA